MVYSNWGFQMDFRSLTVYTNFIGKMYIGCNLNHIYVVEWEGSRNESGRWYCLSGLGELEAFLC